MEFVLDTPALLRELFKVKAVASGKSTLPILQHTLIEALEDGTVTRREADGSIGVCDSKGAMRAMPIDAVEVKERGPRGGVMWIPLTAWAGRTEQLKLL